MLVNRLSLNFKFLTLEFLKDAPHSLDLIKVIEFTGVGFIFLLTAR